MFSLNDKVVYPGYGVALICKVFSREVAGNSVVFYELKFQNKDMTVMVPKDRIEEVGIRPLSSTCHIDDMLKTITQPAKQIKTEITGSNWNKRNKEYQTKISTGSLKDISEIYRDLKFISRVKELSFGEKTILLKAELLLAEEISAAQQVDEDNAIQKLRSLFPASEGMFHSHMQ